MISFGSQPPAMAMPFSGKTMNSATALGPIAPATIQPSHQREARSLASSGASATAQTPPQNASETTWGMPSGAVAARLNGARGLMPAAYSRPSRPWWKMSVAMKPAMNHLTMRMPNLEAPKAPAARVRAYAHAFAVGAIAFAAVSDLAAAGTSLRFIDAASARALVQDRAAAVLDTRGRLAFASGHIDGASRFDWHDTREGADAGGRLPADLDALARRFAAAGVDDARPVLVCGDGGAGWGEEARVAWTLGVLGKNDVQVLDGGCTAWREAGHAWSVGASFAVAPGTVTARPRFHARATKADVRRALADTGVVVIDVRSREEFDGATPYGEARGGHLPRAVHLDWRALSDADGRVLRGDALRSRLNAAGVLEGQPAIVYCTGGVRSAFVTELLREHGIEARNYDGSMWEWAADATAPIE